VPTSAASPPPPPANPASSELRAQITALAAKLDSVSHHELLGVPETATPDQVSAAYLKAVRQYHPDRMAGLGLGDLAKQAERVMARLGEASAILGDPKRRADYVKKLRGEPTEADLARAILEAEVVFKRGESSLKNGDVAGALQAFTESVKKNPNEPQYRAYLAWARYCDPSARKEVLARETLRLINEVLKDRPHFAIAHHWVGEIHKFLGDVSAAEAAFRRAVDADKDFLDAQRELRLIEMRRAKNPPAKAAAATPGTQTAAAKPGLLGKLLRR
jgi:curved DNA-binding protein CbpA